MRARPDRAGERGSVTLEVVVLVPAVLLIVALLVAGGRIWQARDQVTEAAHRAARAATVRSDATTSAALAEKTAAANLAGVGCHHPQVDIDDAALRRDPGVGGTVSVTVRCTVPLADLLVPGLAGEMTIEASAASPVDRYRRRR